jgi:poly(3-hydroxybutyrate) depolymerase
MALRMICMETEQFAGVALLATAMPNVLGARCQPTKSVPLFFMLGTADRNVSYEGGPLGQSGLSIWPAVRLLEFFHERNGCDDAGEQSVESMQSRTVEIEHATTCSGAPVVNYRIIEGGHSVPWADIGRSLLLFFSGKLISP